MIGPTLRRLPGRDGRGRRARGRRLPRWSLGAGLVSAGVAICFVVGPGRAALRAVRAARRSG